jgi:amino acid transporter
MAAAPEFVTGQDIVRATAKRQLRLLPLIGVMFFTVSGGAYGLEDMVSLSGPGIAILLLVLLPIVYSVPSALVIAELGSAMPIEGGYYQWVKAGMGRFWGYQEAFWSWLTTWVDMAIYPVLFADYLAAYWAPAEAGHTMLFSLGPVEFDVHWLVCLAVIWPFTYLNIRGARDVGSSSLVFMAVLLAPFAILCAIGLPKLLIDGIDPLTPMTPPGVTVASAVGAGIWIGMWNYLGWDGLSTVAGEIENPRRTFPLALFLTIPVITICYVLPVLAGMASGVPWDQWTAGTFSDVGFALGGEWLKALITFGGFVSMCGLFSGLLLSVSRIPYVMARDGYLPDFMTRLHPRFGTPWIAIVICSAIYSLFCLNAFTDLVIIDVAVYSFALMLQFATFLILRAKLPDLPRPFRVPGGWPVAIAIVSLPVAIILFAIYKSYDDGGVEAIWKPAIALALGPITFPILLKLVKRDTPTEDVVVDGDVIWSDR